MNKVVPSILLLLAASSVLAAECDCSNYPFKPNPPCYGICVAKLSSKKDIDLSTVKNIDPGVSVGIKVLSESKDRNATDFANIKEKSDLERAALKSLNSGDEAAAK
jgi:hypothetical protein